MLCNISQNAMRWGGTQTPPGGVPRSGTPPDRVPPRGGTQSGTPWGGLPGSGTPPGGGYPGQVPPRGGYPGQVPPPGGYPGRTTEGVLTTRRAVCLLRSRRRTFLLRLCFHRKHFPISNNLVPLKPTRAFSCTAKGVSCMQ